MGLRAVLFDLGGTLIKTAERSEVLKRILGPIGIRSSSGEIDAAFQAADEELATGDYTLPYRRFWRVYNISILKRLGVEENLEELADLVTDEWWANADLELYDDVKETLALLREKELKVGIVTNGFRMDIEEILLMTGTAGCFDIAVGADDVAEPKPSEKIFLYALKKLGIPPSEALFVGDNMRTDYNGAKKAGLKPLLIDRNNQAGGRVRKIQDLREVVKHLT